MKKILYIIGAVLFLSSGMKMSAQELKLGHINTQELISMMPESDSAQKKLQKEAQDLEKQMELMQVEYNNKLEQYVNEQEQMSEIIKQTKEEELQSLQQRIQSFQGTAQQNLQKVQSKLFQPILKKANGAIEEVAKEQGFTYVFDSSAGVIIFAAEDSKDIMPLVKEKLGLE
jgi:outer membrane protein